jgi:GT2 family glycosyltransferase
MKKIGIIVINWKTPQLTIETIESIKKIRHPGFNYHIFLIDNGSPDNSLEILNAHYSHDPQTTIISLSHNLGFALGNNAGIKTILKESYDYALLINSDVVVDPDFLVNLFQVIDKNDQIGAVGPKIYFAPGYEYQKEKYAKKDLGHVIWSVGSAIDWDNIYGSNIGIDQVDHGQFDTPNTNMEFLSACCLLVSSKALIKTGPLSGDYFMYYEDNDFCQRIRSAGFRLAYEPSSRIWHLNSGSGQAGGGPLHDYFLTRNRLIFGFKYASLRTKFALFRDSIRRLFIGSPWQKRGVVDFYLHKFAKGSWQ